METFLGRIKAKKQYFKAMNKEELDTAEALCLSVVGSKRARKEAADE